MKLWILIGLLLLVACQAPRGNPLQVGENQIEEPSHFTFVNNSSEAPQYVASFNRFYPEPPSHWTVIHITNCSDFKEWNEYYVDISNSMYWIYPMCATFEALDAINHTLAVEMLDAYHIKIGGINE